jgi:hypothetical protein
MPSVSAITWDPNLNHGAYRKATVNNELGDRGHRREKEEGKRRGKKREEREKGKEKKRGERRLSFATLQQPIFQNSPPPLQAMA